MAEENNFRLDPTPHRNSVARRAGSARWQSTWRKLELPGDALLLIYFAVIARQYLWWLTDKNRAAWIISAVIAAIVAWLYVSSKELSEEKSAGLPFWIIAVLPLVFVYSMRVVFPDVSFDVLNYRLLHGERA